MELVIVTGLSGSGKSRVMNSLEDIGFFCADNLHPKLIPTFVDLLLQSKEKRERVAIAIDMRVGASFNDIFRAIEELKFKNITYKILFLDAATEIIVNRYSETRRKHPLAEKHLGSLEEIIEAERKQLLPIRQISDYYIDTSTMTPAMCKKMVNDIFLGDSGSSMKIRVMSFGFKHGVPKDANLVFDVRCLPNPFYIDELKHKTGLDREVFDFVMKFDSATTLLEKIYDLIDFLIPNYIVEGKSQLVVAIGCTGGHHRSVVFAEEVFSHLKENKYIPSISHRDISR